MSIDKNELLFSLNCCNEILRGYSLKPNFDTIFGLNGERTVTELENKLKTTHSDTNSDNLILDLNYDEVITLIKIVSITIHELSWELSLRTNFSEIEAMNFIEKLQFNSRP